MVSVEVEALDRSRLLRDVAQALAEHHVNILSCASQTGGRPGRAASASTSSSPTPATSTRSLAAVKRVDCVYDAYRVAARHAHRADG